VFGNKKVSDACRNVCKHRCESPCSIVTTCGEIYEALAASSAKSHPPLCECSPRIDEQNELHTIFWRMDFQESPPNVLWLLQGARAHRSAIFIYNSSWGPHPTVRQCWHESGMFTSSRIKENVMTLGACSSSQSSWVPWTQTRNLQSWKGRITRRSASGLVVNTMVCQLHDSVLSWSAIQSSLVPLSVCLNGHTRANTSLLTI